MPKQNDDIGMEENNNLMEPERVFVHKLVDASKTQRNRAIERLKKWINARTLNPINYFQYDELINIWKGLYYNMWMCDKPVIQDELAQQVSSWVHEFHNEKQAQLYIRAGFETFVREWWGIDQWRLSKFMTFVRYFLQQSFKFLKQQNWLKKYILNFTRMLKEGSLNPNKNQSANGLKMHLIDIYLEELAKVGGTSLKPKKLILLLSPFFNIMKMSESEVLVKHVYKSLFIPIIQYSDVGIDPEIEEEMELVKPFGLQTGEAELVDDNNEDEDAALQFDYKLLSEKLLKVAKVESCNQKRRKLLYDLAKKFDVLSRGIYPLYDMKVPAVFASEQEAFDLDIKSLRELHREVGEICHKKKSERNPEEIEEILKKHNITKKRQKTRRSKAKKQTQ
ncbi:unnamed protein product [Didymodactylos carnosus]|uniref:Uncharacterized protein n=2 Tax=Didymodactylos carnosus TaxID=1234261 RepID=A0A815SEK2_9BILA|nr:unnamed protein product [Didymodactylos carnosus]CAF4354202.1 unnamed protein product [Didymodactylos carnosus]